MVGAFAPFRGRALTHPARDGETRVEVDFATTPAKSARHVAYQAGCIEHMIVEREVVRRNQIDAGGALEEPMLAPKIAGDGFEFGTGKPTLPISFGGFLKLTLRADTREAERVGAQ